LVADRSFYAMAMGIIDWMGSVGWLPTGAVLVRHMSGEPRQSGTIEFCGIVFVQETPMTKENSAVEIYVRLLDEGTDCTRPTQGIVLENGLIQLLPTDNYNQGDEHWEFLPGSIVRAKEVRNADGSYLIAVAREGS
jgi:hypothetical protein